jgi:hypothetical protein
VIETASWRAAPSRWAGATKARRPRRGAQGVTPASQVLAARFDNLREGAKAQVVAGQGRRRRGLGSGVHAGAS